jgi:hypothetical protein
VRFEVIMMRIEVMVFWVVTPCSDVVGYYFNLKMEAARFSETLISYHISTWCLNPECHDLDTDLFPLSIITSQVLDISS